jgi:hypothetical protein
MALMNVNTLPPGGWIYIQNDAAGQPFKKLKSMASYSDFCREVLNCRIANTLPNADLASVEREVQNATCTRLGNDPRYCTTGSGPVTMPAGTVYVGKQSDCGFCGGGKA